MIVKAPKFLAFKAWLAGLQPEDVKATTVLFVIFVREEDDLDSKELRHEQIHVRQCWELGVIGYPFVFLALAFWLRLRNPGDAETAYFGHPFEQEAYMGMYQQDYLETRKLYGWVKYIKTKPV